MAGSTGLEPATSGLTVQCANQAAPRARARLRYTGERGFVHPALEPHESAACCAFAARARAPSRSTGDRGFVHPALEPHESAACAASAPGAPASGLGGPWVTQFSSS